ncbi:CpsD/CapB family tyrosine-protein kinase [Serinicoccus profundi]|uniref:CpsD/CapB family tyrosine-protein kinase n=1 Tax=Serinicoccus profundi TaxID=1078471 RepID=UPI001ED955C4|nr:CpsD/CapB family tyrosine-protein kinase [Serinicoccus profundi]
MTEGPIVGAIAYDKDAPEHPLVVQIDPHSPRAEAFRTLRTNLRYIDADNQPKTLVFTSTIPGEGKSTTTANLALTLAQSGATVCLIEGDLRRPRLLEYLGLENAAGMTDVLVGRADLDDVLQPWGESLWVLGCGPIPPNPSELLGSAAMSRLIDTLEGRFDYIIIDSPPLLAVTDAAILSTQADGVIVVVGTKLVRRDQLDRALGNLQKVDAELLGLVLNRLPVKGPDAYSYAYESYQSDAALEAQGKRAKSRRARRKSKQSS